MSFVAGVELSEVLKPHSFKITLVVFCLHGPFRRTWIFCVWTVHVTEHAVHSWLLSYIQIYGSKIKTFAVAPVPTVSSAFCLFCANFYCEHYGPTSLAASVIVHRLCLLVFCYWKCSLHRQKPDLRPHEQQRNTSATPPSHCRERHNAWKYCGKCQLAISHCFGTEIGHAALEGALYCFITAKSPLKDVNFTREVNCI